MATTGKPKTIKVLGTETYINQRTGEAMDIQVVSVEGSDVDFNKLWLSHVIQAIDLVGEQKIRFAYWLLEQISPENRDGQIPMNIKQMAECSNVSFQAAIRAVKALMDSKFLMRINMKAYQINPDMIHKGNKPECRNVTIVYASNPVEQVEQMKLEMDDVSVDFGNKNETPYSSSPQDGERVDEARGVGLE